MSVSRIWITGYRSLLNIDLRLGELNVVTGANGVGKSNLYRAVSLISRAVNGGLARAIAEEGGMPSVLWAGPRYAKKPVRLKFGFTVDDFSFEVALGLPQPPSPFPFDPEVKNEYVWHGIKRKPSTTYLKRSGSLVELKGHNATAASLIQNMAIGESALSQIQQPELYPELTYLLHEVRGWRFYHDFDTSRTSPLRSGQVSTYSPVLDDDGRNLAAALKTIRSIGAARQLQDAIDGAFPSCSLLVTEEGIAQLGLALDMPGLNRQLDAKELSDGTLRFLCLAAALLTPRPPSLLAFNEPETSLHPDLLPALAKLIVDASTECQLWVTTHSTRLTELIGEQTAFRNICLGLQNGATIATVSEEHE